MSVICVGFHHVSPDEPLASIRRELRFVDDGGRFARLERRLHAAQKVQERFREGDRFWRIFVRICLTIAKTMGYPEIKWKPAEYVRETARKTVREMLNRSPSEISLEVKIAWKPFHTPNEDEVHRLQEELQTGTYFQFHTIT